MPVTAFRAGLRTTRTVTGPTSLRSSLCYRTGTRTLSSHAPHVLAGRVISLSDPLEDEDCDVTGLLDRLNDAMVAYRPGLKDRLKDILITTVHHQTRLHDVLRDKIDTSFATGILSVDQVCKNVESLRLKDEDDVASFYSGVKVSAYTPGLGSSTSLFFPSRSRWDKYRLRYQPWKPKGSELSRRLSGKSPNVVYSDLFPFLDPKTLLTTLPSGPSECHRVGWRRYASSHGEPALQVGKEMQRTRKGSPRLGKIRGCVAQTSNELIPCCLRALDFLSTISLPLSRFPHLYF